MEWWDNVYLNEGTSVLNFSINYMALIQVTTRFCDSGMSNYWKWLLLQSHMLL